jgi:hypothetical protein
MADVEKRVPARSLRTHDCTGFDDGGKPDVFEGGADVVALADLGGARDGEPEFDRQRERAALADGHVERLVTSQGESGVLLELGPPGPEGFDGAVVSRNHQPRRPRLHQGQHRVDEGALVLGEVRHRRGSGTPARLHRRRPPRFRLAGDGAHAQAGAGVGAHARQCLAVLGVE